MTTILETDLSKIMQDSMLDYAMSVITGRALPDVRDGFKPVHRRILYSMNETGMHHNAKYKKSARMVGDVLGKYHPHGDSAVYEAAVRMAQPFSLNALLIDGQGNFGNIDGDGAAAMRYTEMRLTRFAGEFFDDLGKETVPFRPNYDGSEKEPTVLPASLPNLVINGGEGIAVGMASSIPPHNLRAVIDATKLLMVEPEATTAQIVGILKAPDFPTGALVHDLDGFAEAVETGRGRVRNRAKWHEEDRPRGGKALVITELPYMVNKAALIEKIAELHNDDAKNKRELLLQKIQDESNKEGVRIWIALQPDVTAERAFHDLISKRTDLEVSVNYNCTVLRDGRPVTLGLKQLMLEWIKFRREVVLARFIYDRKQALARLHLLAGYMAALGMLDEVIRTIREAEAPAQAKAALMALLSVDEVQAQAILDLRLQKLTGMELDSIREEHAKVTARVAELTAVIDSPQRIDEVITSELDTLSARYGIERRTEIAYGLSDVTREDLIAREDVLLAMTRGGYIKRMPANALERQNRGTRGKKAMEIGDDDSISFMRQSHSHDSLMVFAKSGQVYGIKAYRIPEGSLTQKGRHIRNVIEGLDEEISAVLALPEQDPTLSVLTITRSGQVKRSSLEDYAGATRRGGIRGVGLDEGDTLVAAFAVHDADHVMMVSSGGQAIRFALDDVRVMGRAAGGVRGMKLEPGESIVGATVLPDGKSEGQYLLCVGELGVGKRTAADEFPVQGRAGMGVIAFKANTKTGELVTAMGVTEAQDLIMFASNGVSNRISVRDIRETGRAASGVILMNLDDGQKLVSATTALRAEPDSGDEDEQAGASEGAQSDPA